MEPENLTSPWHLDSFVYPTNVQTDTFMIHWILQMVIIVCGIFGNILSLIVLWKKDDSSTTSKFLRSLAVADTMTLSSKCIWMLYKWGETFSPYQSQTWILSSFAFYILSLLPDRISKCITVAKSVDRLVAVTLPLRYKIICRPMRIRVVIVLIYVIIASTYLPEIFDVFLYHIQTGEIEEMILILANNTWKI